MSYWGFGRKEGRKEGEKVHSSSSSPFYKVKNILTTTTTTNT